MKTFEFDEEIKSIPPTSFWKALLEKTNLEFGVINLKPGQQDTQYPHKMDEVYFITEGNGYLNVNGEDVPITDGKIIFVPKEIPHKFHGNTKPIKGFYALG